ncbi:MAG: hypothetical protein N0A24_08480 [Armatimonadetes bacterium]|nr:hypothetical protein [Armatimonadota bacterium]MDW8154226.1 hypothetical protein [Armatimonadota bacterium]
MQECAAEVERLRGESRQLRRLVAAYREREALYRQRLEEANDLLLIPVPACALGRPC